MINTNIEWLENIPDTWKLERLQWHLQEIKENNSPMKCDRVLSLTNDRGVIPYEEKGAQGNISKEDYSQYKLAYPNTIVANSMNVLIGSVGLCKYFGCVSPVYYVFKAREEKNIEFFNYIFQTQQFQKELRKYANGILEIRLRVSSSDILKRYVPIPDKEEQEKIVNFLKEKETKINNLISIQNDQIATLKEYKKNLIIQLVNEGLNKSASMVEPSVDYVLPYPAHWKLLRGKNILNLLERPVLESDKVITCFRDGEVTLRSNRREEGFTFADKEIGYQGIEPGDLVIHGMDGFAGAIGISTDRGKGSPVLSVCDSKENKKYIMYYLRSLAYRDVILALSTGIRVRSCDLRWNKVANLLYPVPPRKEQDEIVAVLDKMSADIDNLIIGKQQKIEKLNEYKKSLIYEYITGKKRVE